MSIDTFGPAKDWVKNLNNDLQILDQNDIVVSQWTNDGVVLLNGWHPAGNGNGGMVSWRTIKRRNGEPILTEIHGTLETKDRWDGTKVEFARIAGVPQPTTDAAFGSNMSADVDGVATGYASVGLSWSNSTLSLTAMGKRNDTGQQYLDGWHFFGLMY